MTRGRKAGTNPGESTAIGGQDREPGGGFALPKEKWKGSDTS